MRGVTVLNRVSFVSRDLIRFTQITAQPSVPFGMPFEEMTMLANRKVHCGSAFSVVPQSREPLARRSMQP